MYKLVRFAAITLRKLYYRLSNSFDCELPPFGMDVSRFVRLGQLIKYAEIGTISYHTYQGPGRMEQEHKLELLTAYATIADRLFARFIDIKENRAAGIHFDQIVMALSAKYGVAPQSLESDGQWQLKLWKIPKSSLVYVLKYDSQSSGSQSVCYYEPLNPGFSAPELLDTWLRPPSGPGFSITR